MQFLFDCEGCVTYFMRENPGWTQGVKLVLVEIDGKDLIISDPMLATGTSMALVYKALLQQGNPRNIYVVSAIATPDALEFLKDKLPSRTEYFIGAIDKELTAESYIVPGLGDAGDLAYGVKV